MTIQGLDRQTYGIAAAGSFLVGGGALVGLRFFNPNLFHAVKWPIGAVTVGSSALCLYKFFQKEEEVVTPPPRTPPQVVPTRAEILEGDPLHFLDGVEQERLVSFARELLPFDAESEEFFKTLVDQVTTPEQLAELYALGGDALKMHLWTVKEDAFLKAICPRFAETPAGMEALIALDPKLAALKAEQLPLVGPEGAPNFALRTLTYESYVTLKANGYDTSEFYPWFDPKFAEEELNNALASSTDRQATLQQLYDDFRDAGVLERAQFLLGGVVENEAEVKAFLDHPLWIRDPELIVKFVDWSQYKAWKKVNAIIDVFKAQPTSEGRTKYLTHARRFCPGALVVALPKLEGPEVEAVREELRNNEQLGRKFGCYHRDILDSHFAHLTQEEILEGFRAVGKPFDELVVWYKDPFPQDSAESVLRTVALVLGAKEIATVEKRLNMWNTYNVQRGNTAYLACKIDDADERYIDAAIRWRLKTYADDAEAYKTAVRKFLPKTLDRVLASGV